MIILLCCTVDSLAGTGIFHQKYDPWPNTTIPDNGGYYNRKTLQINVSGIPSNATIKSVKYTCWVDHPYRGDLSVDLTAYINSQWVSHRISDRQGGSADNIDQTETFTTFNGGCVSPDNPNPGTNPVSNFNPNGQWYLVAWDNAQGDEGALDGFEIWIDWATPADLSVQSVDATNATYNPGDLIVVNNSIKNIGGFSSNSYTVDFYASANTIISTGDYKIGSDSRSALGGGDTHNYDSTCYFPPNGYDGSSIPAGNYYIGVIVTCSNDSVSGNNTSYDPSIVQIQNDPPDIEVISVDAANGTYQPGDQIVVSNLIQNIGDQASSNYTVDFYASLNAIISTGDYKIGSASRNALGGGDSYYTNHNCYFPSTVPAGNYYIGVIVTCSNDSSSGNNTGYDSSTIKVIPPDVNVHGRMGYRDRNNGYHPIRYALVKVIDVDPFFNPDDVIETYTDSDGYYGLTFPNNEDDGLDLYVQVLSQGASGAYPGTSSEICNVVDEINSGLYFMKSPTVSNYSQSDLPLGLTMLNTHDDAGAFDVYDSIVESFHKAKTFFGIELGEITVFWPGDDTYYNPENNEIYFVQEDRLDRDVIMHEYGHYIADTYNFAQGSVGPDSSHYYDYDLRYHPSNRTEEEARNLAFREAWPTLFSVATQYGDTWYPNSGDTIYNDTDDQTISDNLEENTSLLSSPGQYFESMNVCTLWDIFDNHSDSVDNQDTLSDTSLSKIWTISRYDQPYDIIDFWNSWFGRYGYAREITRIFLDHEMTFIAQYPSNPSPSNGAVSQSINVDLNWNDASNATSYNVYFGTDPTPDSTEYIGNTGVSSWNLGTLNYGITYYWQIVAKGGYAEAESPVWSFITQYILSLTVQGQGSVLLNPSGGIYNSGTTVQLTANPSSGWHFVRWEGSSIGSTNPTTILMNSNKDVTAVFAQDATHYTLSLTVQGQGSVSLNPSGGIYNSGTTVQLTANPSSGWHFVRWEGSLSGSTNPASIVMNGNKSVTAVFEQDQVNYSLSVNVQGQGSVSLSPSGGVYNAGTNVQLTASHAAGWHFVRWEGSLSGSTNPASIVMNSNKSVTAVFEGDECIDTVSDFDNDCDVDADDLSVFVTHWLETDCIEPDLCGGADLNADSSVNLLDFTIFAEEWMVGFVPTPPTPVKFYDLKLDTNPGWTTQGQWTFGIPTGGGGLSHGNPDPVSGHSGNNVYGVNINGDYDLTEGGPWYLTTGPIDCTGQSGVLLKFWRWLNTDYQPYTWAGVKVSNNGTSWTTIWQIGDSLNGLITDSAWLQYDYNISNIADNQPTVYIRWGYMVTNGAYSYSGWNIDDIELWGNSLTGESEPNGMTWVTINDPGVSGHEIFNGEMSKYETTNAQYCQYLNAAKVSSLITVYNNVVYATSDTSHSQPYYNLAGEGFTYDEATNGGATRINYSGSVFTVDSGFENHPVTQISWYGATAFCNYYGYRLPTEWEWQAVADHTESDPYVYGCGATIANSIANYYGSSHPNGTTVVGAFGAYGYGMCDMAGNVWEWTSTTSDSDSVIRGGCWNYYSEDCSVSSWGPFPPNIQDDSVGFRPCR